AAALLVALGGRDDGVDVDSVERGRQAGALEQLRDLGAQGLLAGEPERGEQPEADRLAVAQPRVAGRGLQRVADRVAEVEDLAGTAVALVGGDHGELGARALQDGVLALEAS